MTTLGYLQRSSAVQAAGGGTPSPHSAARIAVRQAATRSPRISRQEDALAARTASRFLTMQALADSNAFPGPTRSQNDSRSQSARAARSVSSPRSTDELGVGAGCGP